MERESKKMEEKKAGRKGLKAMEKMEDKKEWKKKAEKKRR